MMRLRTQEQRPVGSKRGLLVRILGLFRPYRGTVALLVLMIALGAALGLLPALLIKGIIDAASPGGAGRGRIDELFIFLVITVVASGFAGVAVGWLNQSVGQGVMYRLRADLHERLQRLSLRFFTQTRTGEILSRVTTDVNAVQDALTGTFTDFLTNVLTFVIALGLMFALQWQVALLILVLLPVWVIPTVRVGRVMRRLTREWHEASATMSAQLEETLSVSGAMLVKTYARQDYEAQRFGDSNRTLRNLAMRRMLAGRWFNMGTSLFGALAPGAVYWFGGRAVVGDSLSMGSVVALAVLTQRVFQPFAGIARVNTTVLSSFALFERIFEYLDLPVEVDEREDAVVLGRARGHVRFEDVIFAYVPGGAPALDRVDLEVLPGQMAALVGPSGAGKTTVTYLLQRFYDPQAGRVLLDGHDVRDLTLASLADAVGAVMQDTYLFHASLADNIRYGRLDASDADLEAAATAAGLGDLVARLPAGLATVVGERGYRLSGGEKQRVSIARAILKDAPVLILDEATASLDSRLERQIRDSTARLAEGRTVIAIAHRLSTVLEADVIFVVDEGQIVERGTHRALLARNGLYASLYREQFEVQGQPESVEVGPAEPAAAG